MFKVKDIMTPIENGISIEKKDVSSVNHLTLEYDITPVTKWGRIIGLLEKGNHRVITCSEKWFVWYEINVTDLLELFIKTEKKALLVIKDQDIVGIVSPSDFNKLPFKLSLKYLLLDFEQALLHLVIDKYSGRLNEVEQLLDNTRIMQLKQVEVELNEGNSNIHYLHFMDLIDIVSVISKDTELRDKVGYRNAENTMKVYMSIVNFRYQLFTYNRPLIRIIPDDLSKLSSRIRLIKSVIRKANNF